MNIAKRLPAALGALLLVAATATAQRPDPTPPPMSQDGLTITFDHSNDRLLVVSDAAPVVFSLAPNNSLLINTEPALSSRLLFLSDIDEVAISRGGDSGTSVFIDAEVFSPSNGFDGPVSVQMASGSTTARLACADCRVAPLANAIGTVHLESGQLQISKMPGTFPRLDLRGLGEDVDLVFSIDLVQNGELLVEDSPQHSGYVRFGVDGEDMITMPPGIATAEYQLLQGTSFRSTTEHEAFRLLELHGNVQHFTEMTATVPADYDINLDLAGYYSGDGFEMSGKFPRTNLILDFAHLNLNQDDYFFSMWASTVSTEQAMLEGIILDKRTIEDPTPIYVFLTPFTISSIREFTLRPPIAESTIGLRKFDSNRVSDQIMIEGIGVGVEYSVFGREEHHVHVDGGPLPTGTRLLIEFPTGSDFNIDRDQQRATVNGVEAVTWENIDTITQLIFNSTGDQWILSE